MLGGCGVVMLHCVPVLSSLSTWHAYHSSSGVGDGVLMAEVAHASSLFCWGVQAWHAMCSLTACVTAAHAGSGQGAVVPAGRLVTGSHGIAACLVASHPGFTQGAVVSASSGAAVVASSGAAAGSSQVAVACSSSSLICSSGAAVGTSSRAAAQGSHVAGRAECGADAGRWVEVCACG